MSRIIHKWLVLFIFAAVPFALFFAGCSDDPPSTVVTGSSGSGGETGGTGEGICLLNNCTEDLHCAGCSDGRVTCKVDENRCVACDPVTQTGCGPDEECSSYGICVPSGLTCDTDGSGNPTVVCNKNADCKACSPMHQVCDTVTGKCQACIETNTQHCLSTDICADINGDGRPESCSPKCPTSCTVDNDCSQCGGPGAEAHACFQHKCAECSDTYPCAAGLECLNGVCTPPCGLPGPVAGTCTAKEDCNYCGATTADHGTWDCKTPVNDPNGHGTCMPPAGGCSDLGQSVAVLPEPYSNYTQLCSNDNDCSGIGIQYNVGKALRDLLGKDEVYGVKIQDADVTYAMPICADIDITEEISCGICVPCKEDSDCQPIPVDPLVADLFKGEPLAQIAFALLLDLLWGDNPDHNLNFWCQPVAAGYGACLPCGNPLQPCWTSAPPPSSGNCSHSACETGTENPPAPLSTSCGQCEADVCAQDAYCCTTSWDALCVSLAESTSSCSCGTNLCPHDPCTEGDKLNASCSTCVADICAADSFCCDTLWDSYCTGYAADTTTYPSCAGAC